MLDFVFNDSVLLKPWEGCLYEKGKAVNHLAEIPNTKQFFIAATTAKSFFEPYYYMDKEQKDVAKQFAESLPDSGLKIDDFGRLAASLKIAFDDHHWTSKTFFPLMEIRLLKFNPTKNPVDIRL